MGSSAAERRRTAVRPRLLILTPDFPPARGGIQVVVERLAAGMHGFETLGKDMANNARHMEAAMRAPSGRRRSLPRNASATARTVSSRKPIVISRSAS